MTGKAFVDWEDAKPLVLSGLRHSRPKCFLIEVPPGCDDRDMASEMWRDLRKEPRVGQLGCLVTADAARDEGELINAMIGGWLADDASLRKAWNEASGIGFVESAPQRLLRFADMVRGRESKLLVLFRRFDKVFLRMSGEVLAAMRDLEHEDVLATACTSPLPYYELYERRAALERSFTSDYGQAHVRLTIGPLTREAALRRWTDEFRLPAKDQVSLSYFELAYAASGGLPIAFKAAANRVDASCEPDPDLSGYRSDLATHLPEAFARLLGYEGDNEGSGLLEALARVHRGGGTAADHDLIGGHRWSFLLFSRASGTPQLVCEAVGAKAVELLRAHRRRAGTDPRSLYEQGEYAACCERLSSWEGPVHPALGDASAMLLEVFGNLPRSLYFGPTINWVRVKSHALRAARNCAEAKGRDEFIQWERLASVHEQVGPAQRKSVQNHLDSLSDAGKVGIEASFIRLGVRALASKRDPNSVTSAYSAVPLVEDILRHYVILILGLKDIGNAFMGIRDEALQEWWTRSDLEFQRPAADARLGGSDLAILAAVASAEKGRPLFPEPKQVSYLLRLLSDARNVLGHYVVTPSEGTGRQLSEQACFLLDRLGSHGGCNLRVSDLEAWVQPPRGFMSFAQYS